MQTMEIVKNELMIAGEKGCDATIPTSRESRLNNVEVVRGCHNKADCRIGESGMGGLTALQSALQQRRLREERRKKQPDIS